MRQIIIAKNPLVKSQSGSRIDFFHPPSPDENAPDYIVLDGGKPKKITIPFSVRIIGGGTFDLDFKISKDLAAYAVNLLGAYWDGEKVTAYLMPLSETEVHVPLKVPILLGTLVEVATYRQVEDRIIGATVVSTESGVMRLDKKVERKRRKPKKL